MAKLRDPNWFLIFAFVAIIAIAPLVQTINEITSDDGVIAYDVFGEIPTAANLRAYEKRVENASWAGRLSRPWLQAQQFKWLKEGGEKVVVGRDGWYFFKPGLKYMLARHDPKKDSKGTNDAIGAIVDFRNQLAARGIHLLVVPVPNKESIYPDRLITGRKNIEPMIAPRTRELMENLGAANIEFVDLFKEFRGALNEGQLYLAQDTHWSPIGIEVAARAISRRLTELGWVQPGQTEYHKKPANVHRVGDIIRMLQAPRIERAIQPESVSAVQVLRAADGKAYADEPSAEILVIGDSFMRIYQQDAPSSAGFIAHLAKELKQPMMSLVNDGGGSTLVREELAMRPFFLNKKKVVVWEFVERDMGIGVGGWRKIALPPAGSAGGATNSTGAK